MEIEALLKKIEQLAPRFGRASEDLAAIVSRGRGGDYKGVMQNCRLVLEMLLRALVTTELRQTPGKAMLDELITKFRQQANAGLIPTNVLAHMGTVQAWGNLSSHDHAGSLKDEGVRVGPEEVATSLNSMVAILSWYSARYPQAPKAPAEKPAVAAQPRSKTALRLGAAGLVLGGVLAGGYLLFRGDSPGPATLRRVLDAFYVAAREPLPPPPCRTAGDAGKLAAAAAHLVDTLPEATRVAEGQQALLLLAGPSSDASAEHAYFLGRAQLQAGQDARAALATATRCEGFAAAENLAGKAALRAQDAEQADAHFGKAIASHPGFAKPRYNRALIRLKQQKVEEAIGLLLGVVAEDPSFAEGHFFLGAGYEATGREAEAKSSFCKAMELGYRLATERCER